MTTTSKRLPVLDVPNPAAALSNFRRRQNRLVNGLVELGLEYANKVVGSIFSPKAEDYFTLRECIYYRLGAMVFHLDLLLAIQKNHQRQHANRPFDDRARTNLLDMGTQQQMALLDSIIFHAISLFDYFGNLIDYICGGKGQMSLKWNGALKSVRDPSNVLSTSPVAPTIIHLHRSFVDRLYEHRSHLIHLRSDRAGASARVPLVKGTPDFTVFAPNRFVALFPELAKKAEKRRLTIRYVSFWVTARSLDASMQLVEPLLLHLEVNRKTPEGFAIFGNRPRQ